MPECETAQNNRNISYSQPWLKNAIPSVGGKLDHCHRFAIINKTSNQCTADMFDSTTKIPCDDYVYASDEINMQTEVENLERFIQFNHGTSY